MHQALADVLGGVLSLWRGTESELLVLLRLLLKENSSKALLGRFS
jgi:hypothetical protein